MAYTVNQASWLATKNHAPVGELVYQDPNGNYAIPTTDYVISSAGILSPRPVDANNVPQVSVSGSLAYQNDAQSVTANTPILVINYTSPKYSDSIIQVVSDTAGILSAVINGKSSTFNSGIALVPGELNEFNLSLLSGITYNLEFSANATLQINWQVI